MNRFKEDLNQEYGVTLLRFDYDNGKYISIRTTIHSKARYEERGIDLNEVCSAIVALGKQVIYTASEKGDDIAILDKQKNETLAIIITFEEYEDQIQARLRTVIQKKDVFIKDGTRIYNLKNYKGGFGNGRFNGFDPRNYRSAGRSEKITRESGL